MGGKINIDYLITKNNITYQCSNDMYEHSGVKGQRWGVRRCQNPDGSLALEGRKYQAKGFQRASNKNTKKVKSKECLCSEARTVPVGVKIYRTTTAKKERE